MKGKKKIRTIEGYPAYLNDSIENLEEYCVKVLGYEIIRKEATTTGTKEVVVGFVERDKNGKDGLTKYTDVIDAINNRAFEYKVRAYDYNLNVTQETTIW